MPPPFPFKTTDGRDGVVRVAQAKDGRACLAITAEAMRERPRTLAVVEDEFWTPREWRRHRLDWGPKGVTLVAELEGKVVGHYGIIRGRRLAVRHTAELGITVGATARGCGVGRALMAGGETWAREHGVTRVVLRVFRSNERAQRLYRGLGYLDEGVEHAAMRFPEGEVDIIRMYKVLDRQREQYD